MKLLFHSFVLTICDYLFSTRTYRLLVEVSQGWVYSCQKLLLLSGSPIHPDIGNPSCYISIKVVLHEPIFNADF